MKNKVLSLLSAAVLALALGSMAKADSFNLNFQNGNVPGPAPYGTVSVTGGGTSVTITFDAAAGLDMFGSDAVAFNVGAGGTITNIAVTGYTVVVGAPGAPTIQNGGDNTVNMDGFGSGASAFDVGAVGGNGSSAGYSEITITITGTGLTLAQFEGTNGAGVQFAEQVGGYNGNTLGYPAPGCTGFVGSQIGNTTGVSTNATCGGTSVPEPGSLALFGTGILGMAGYLRRKLLS